MSYHQRNGTPHERITTTSRTTDTCWWLNTNRALWPSAPESAYAALGHGQNTVWIDPEHDVVVVLRWLDYGEDDGTTVQSEQDAFYAKLLAGLD